MSDSLRNQPEPRAEYGRQDIAKDVEKEEIAAPRLTSPEHHVVADRLARKLSARQAQMIAIGGTIGTGLFLGTGKSLAAVARHLF
jgi:amino acid permease